jgi:hypothetical protein
LLCWNGFQHPHCRWSCILVFMCSYCTLLLMYVNILRLICHSKFFTLLWRIRRLLYQWKNIKATSLLIRPIIQSHKFKYSLICMHISSIFKWGAINVNVSITFWYLCVVIVHYFLCMLTYYD